MRIGILTIAVVALSESEAFPLSGDHGPAGRTSLRSDMSPELRQLINREDRVHGYFVNFEDIFFYAGDTVALNEFLSGFAKLKNTDLTISFNQSLTHASSPWNKPKPQKVANWRLYCAPFDVHAWSMLKAENRDLEAIRAKSKELTAGPEVAHLQIRIGGGVELDKLKIPRHIELTLIDKEHNAAQSIRDFVAEHEKLRTHKPNQEPNGLQPHGPRTKP